MSNIPADPFFFQEEENDFNLKEVLYKYLSYWKWFAISLFLALVAAFVYLKYQVPVYRVHSSILIKDEKKGLGGDDMLKELNLFSSNKVVDNEIEILKSYNLMERVVKGLNLNISYLYKDGFNTVELYGEESPIRLEVKSAKELLFEEPLIIKLLNNSSIEINEKSYPINQAISTPYGVLKVTLVGVKPGVTELKIDVSPIEAITEAFMEGLTVEPSSKMSSVLLLSMEVTSRQKGRDIINRLIEEYNNAGLEDKNKVAANTLRFIEDRLKLISGDLQDVEKTVENFKSREGITDISAESQLFLQSVQQNDNELNQVKIQQNVLNAIDQYVRQKNNTAGTVPATLGISDPTLLGLIQSLSELESKRAESVKLVKEDNPIVTALDDQIRGVKASIAENIQTLRKSLAITRTQLESQNARMEGMIKTVPGKERALVDITRQQAIKNNLYIFLLEKREETALSYASAVSDSRTVDAARSSIKPVKPVKRNIYLLFALVGLAVPFGIIYVMDLLNDKVQSRKDIEKATKAPILGEISYSDTPEALVVTKTSRSVIAEQIRALRTNLSFLSPGNEVQSILFTSSISGEGKSFISLNLGASLALTDKKTIILEFDLRKPKLHQALEVENSKGLSNYLIGKAELAEIIKPVPGHENFFIITCGPIPPNPAEIMLKGRMEELYRELRARFDYIITDAPPVGAVTDAQILEKHVDATLYVIRHSYTPIERLKSLNNLDITEKFKRLSLVFNAIELRGRYGYGRSYGYGYYEESNGKERRSFLK